MQLAQSLKRTDRREFRPSLKNGCKSQVEASKLDSKMISAAYVKQMDTNGTWFGPSNTTLASAAMMEIIHHSLVQVTHITHISSHFIVSNHKFEPRKFPRWVQPTPDMEICRNLFEQYFLEPHWNECW